MKEVFLGIVFVLFSSMIEANSRCRYSFSQDHQLNLQEARESFKGAVVNLALKTDKLVYLGTAFLLNEEQGLYLTAQHVVNGFQTADVLVAIHGEYPSYEEITVDVIPSNTIHDLALLQVHDIAKLPLHFKALGNINFREAKEGDNNMFAFGRGPIDGERELRSASAEFTNWTKKRSLMQVNTTIVSGDSGGPLIDKFGRVTGVYKAKTGSGVAATGEFTPSFFIDEVLNGIKPNRKVSEIKSKLSDPPYSESEFAKDLNELSNIELLMLVELLEKRSSTQFDGNLLRCPLYTALVDRNMGHIAYKIARDFPSAEKARTLVASIGNNGAFGNPNKETDVLDEAILLFNHALDEADEKGYGRDYKGYVVLDMANAKYKKAILSVGADREKYYADSIRTYLEASQLNSNLDKLTFAMSGNALVRLNKPELAARSYKTSKYLAEVQNSRILNWVPASFSLSLSKANCSGDCASDLELISSRDLSEVALKLLDGVNRQQ